MTTIEMKQAVRQRVQECHAICERYFGKTFPKPKTTFEVKGKVGGLAYYAENRVDFNLILLRENFDQYIKQVVPHEVSHLCEVWQYGGHQCDRGGRRLGHGPRWKSIMRNVFGLLPDRCHSMDTSQASTKSQRRWTYIAPKCGCEYQVSTTIHNRVLKGQRRICPRHKHPVILKSEWQQQEQERVKWAANDAAPIESPKEFKMP